MYCTLCLKKISPTFLAITRESIDGFLYYLAEMLLRKEAIICCYIFPPHLTNASTLPCETENTEIVSFHVMLHVDLPTDTQVTSELSPNNSWTIFHS